MHWPAWMPCARWWRAHYKPPKRRHLPNPLPRPEKWRHGAGNAAALAVVVALGVTMATAAAVARVIPDRMHRAAAAFVLAP